MHRFIIPISGTKEDYLSEMQLQIPEELQKNESEIANIYHAIQATLIYESSCSSPSTLFL